MSTMHTHVGKQCKGAHKPLNGDGRSFNQIKKREMDAQGHYLERSLLKNRTKRKKEREKSGKNKKK